MLLGFWHGPGRETIVWSFLVAWGIVKSKCTNCSAWEIILKEVNGNFNLRIQVLSVKVAIPVFSSFEIKLGLLAPK